MNNHWVNKPAAAYPNQSDLVASLYRLNGLAVAIISLLDPLAEVGPDKQFAARMIAEVLDLESMKLLNAAEKM